MTLSTSPAFSHAISHTTLPGRGQSNPHFMGCKFKVETFASAFSLHVGAGLELGGILAAEATPLALLLTLWAAHAGWGARQCRVVPPRVTSGTCCRNSDRDKGVQEGLVVDEPCLGGRKGVLACGIQQSRLGAGREPEGEGTKGQRAGLGTQRQQTRAPSFPLRGGGGAAAWYLEAGPLRMEAFVWLFVAGLRPGQDCGVSRGTGQGAARHSFPASALCLPGQLRPSPGH